MALKGAPHAFGIVWPVLRFYFQIGAELGLPPEALEKNHHRPGSRTWTHEWIVERSAAKRAIEQQGWRPFVTYLTDGMRQPRTLRSKSNAVQDVRQPCVADANRTLRSPRSLECHSRRRLVALYSDRVEYIDRCAIARIGDPVTAIIGVFLRTLAAELNPRENRLFLANACQPDIQSAA
jgi:hypothetical protein